MSIKISLDDIKQYVHSPKLQRALLSSINLEIVRQALKHGVKVSSRVETEEVKRDMNATWSQVNTPDHTHIGTLLFIEEIPKEKSDVGPV